MKIRISIITAIFTLAISGAIGQTNVANFKNDFQLNPAANYSWHYYWNKPSGWVAKTNSGNVGTGQITETASYTPLISSGKMLTADGDEDGANSTPDSYLRLNATGGHAGGNGATTALDRYAIIAYTVSQSGYYYITNSSISLANATSNGLLVNIMVNSQAAILNKAFPSTGTSNFDSVLGYLNVGDNIYVAIGANGNTGFDSYTMNYSIGFSSTVITHHYNVADYGAVGDGVTNDFTSIRNAVLAAMNDPYPAVLSFSNKTYRCIGGGTLFNISQKMDKTIEGNGATFVVQPGILGITIAKSSNIKIQDLSFDSDPLSWTQGVVQNVNATNGTFTMNIPAEYPIPADHTTPFGSQPFGMLWGPTGYVIKDEYISIDQSKVISGRTVEFTIRADQKSKLNNMLPNDQFTIDVYGVSGSFNSISTSANIICDNLTFYTTRALVFVLSANTGSLMMNQVSMRRKPGTTRLLSCYRDGFHCINNKIGPQIQNCYFEGLCDDATNLHSSNYTVTTVKSDTHFVVNTTTLEVGDTLIFLDLYNGVELGKTRVASIPATNEIITASPITNIVTGTPEITTATKIFNISKSNAGFKISNNIYAGQRRFAMLIRSPNGVIENNVGENLSGGIMIMNEINTFNEGPIPYNIKVRNNSFTNIRGCPLMINAQTYKTPPGNRLIHDILIENNKFGASLTTYSAGLIYDASNITLSGNAFVNSATLGALSLNNCRNINILCHNTFNNNPISSVADGIFVQANMTNQDVIFGSGDLQTASGFFTASKANICKETQNEVFTINPVASATGYDWNFTGEGAAISDNKNSASVDFNSSATNGILSVSPKGTCGSLTGLDRYWNFSLDELGWLPTHNCSLLNSDNGLKVTITGTDPYFASPDGLGVDASKVKYLILKIKNNTTSTPLSLFWQRNDATTFISTMKQNFTISASDTEYHEYVVDLSQNTEWKGIIKQLRFDPSDNATGNLSIKYIKLTTAPSIKLNLKDNPVADAGADIAICKGSTTTLKGLGGPSYLWSNGATTQNTNVTPSITTTYSLTVTNAAGCKATDNVKVTVYANCDCNGVENGTAYFDMCNTCVEGNTGLKPCIYTNLADIKTSANSVSVFPNPVKDHLFVQSESDCKVTIYNIHGKMIIESARPSTKHAFSVKDWPSGVYELIVKTTNGVNFSKVVVL